MLTLAPSFSHESSGISRRSGQCNVITRTSPVKWKGGGCSEDYQNDDVCQYAALLELRNTPRQDTGISPAEFMFGKNTRSLPPSTGTKHNPSKKQVMMKRAKRRLAISSYYNKGARDLTPSQPVYYQYKEGRRPGWRRDTVRTEHSERSYIIDRRDGVYRRNSAPTPYNT